MGYAVKRKIFGHQVWVGVPMGESITLGDGTHLTCNVWPDRLSDCRINGTPVNYIRYLKAKRGSRRRSPMTPATLRFRLKCYVHPLGS